MQNSGVDAESYREALGLQLDKDQWLRETYSLEGETLYEVLQGSNVYGVMALTLKNLIPGTLRRRSLFAGTIGFLGRALVLSVMRASFYWRGRSTAGILSEGRTMERMGFRSAGIESIRKSWWKEHSSGRIRGWLFSKRRVAFCPGPHHDGTLKLHTGAVRQASWLPRHRQRTKRPSSPRVPGRNLQGPHDGFRGRRRASGHGCRRSRH